MAHYFRENYTKSLQTAPHINSPIQITAIEVWVSNRTNRTENSRYILALLDLAEKNTYNQNLAGNPTSLYPNTGLSNSSNSEISNNLLELISENGRNPNNNFIQTFFANSGAEDNYAN